ncbi:MAG: ArsR/SmtB family transcription factor [Planctomycetota bacterium]
MSKQQEPSTPVPPGGCCNVFGTMLSPRFFKALGDPNRLALLSRLADCGSPRPVGEIACCCPVDISVVSRHLAILREAGLVESERCGKEVRYTVRYDTIVRNLREIADAIEKCCSDSCRTRRKEPEHG